MSLFEFNSNNLLNWTTAFALFEIPMAYFYLSIVQKPILFITGIQVKI